MVEKSKGQTEVKGSGGGLLPAVEGHSLGTLKKSLSCMTVLFHFLILIDSILSKNLHYKFSQTSTTFSILSDF